MREENENDSSEMRVVFLVASLGIKKIWNWNWNHKFLLHLAWMQFGCERFDAVLIFVFCSSLAIWNLSQPSINMHTAHIPKRAEISNQIAQKLIRIFMCGKAIIMIHNVEMPKFNSQIPNERRNACFRGVIQSSRQPNPYLPLAMTKKMRGWMSQ